MPYKAKQHLKSKHPRKKQRYKVMNWSSYNKSLKKRGALSLYFPGGNIRSQFINENPYVSGVSGRQKTYSPAYIELCYTFYCLLRFGIRQTTGYIEDVWKMMNLDIPVPSFGHLSDSFSAISIDIHQSC